MAVFTERLKYGGTGSVGVNDTIYQELYRVYDSDGATLPYDIAMAHMNAAFPIFGTGPNGTVVERVDHRYQVNTSSHRFIVRYRKNIPFGGAGRYPQTSIRFENEEMKLYLVGNVTDAISGSNFVVMPDDDAPHIPYTRVRAYRQVGKVVTGGQADPDAIADIIYEAAGGLYNVPFGGSRLYVFLGGSVTEIGQNEVAVRYQFMSKARIPEILKLNDVDLDVPFPELAALQEYRYPDSTDPDPEITPIPVEDLYHVNPPVLP